MIIECKKGLEWDYVIIVEQKKESFKVQCKCRVVQILGSSESVTSLALRPRKFPGLIQITDHISYIDHWACYFYCKERVGLNWGGLLSLAILTDACCEVRRTPKNSLISDRTPNGTFHIRLNAWKSANPNFWPNLELNNPAKNTYLQRVAARENLF